jgi:SAM-dependent methyltransferase
MYLKLAAAHSGPVLELACGSGRIAVALAAAGHAVTGVDRDPDMLDRARKAWTRHQQQDAVAAGGAVAATGALDLIEADILDSHLDMGRRFSLAILAINSLLLLGDDDAKRRALHTMARHLADDGRAVVDVWLPTPDDLALYDGQVMLDWIREDNEAKARVAKSWSATYDPARQRASVTTYFDVGADARTATRTVREDEIWFVGAEKLIALAIAAGLEPEIVAGDYDLGARTSHSERVVLVCRRGTAQAPLI